MSDREAIDRMRRNLEEAKAFMTPLGLASADTKAQERLIELAEDGLRHKEKRLLGGETFEDR